MMAEIKTDTPLPWLPRVLREGSVLAWQHLLILIVLNLLWIVCAATLVLAGPATLSVFGYLAALRDDQRPTWRDLPGRLRQNLLPGSLWTLTVCAFAFLVYANLTFWPAVTGELGRLTVWIFWGYLIWLFVAAQPFLLDALVTQRLPYRQAWRAAALEVLRRPVAAHLWVLIPALLALIGSFFRTPALVVLVSLLLAYAAVQVRPVTVPAPPQDGAENDLQGGVPR